MVKIYVVDNGGQWTHREWRVLKYLGVDTKIVPNTTPFEELEDADGLVMSGGAARIAWETLKLGNCGDYLNKLNIPVLGMCLSHQFIALHFGGDVGPANAPEFGLAKLKVHDEHLHDPIFEDVPKYLQVWESHNDEIKVLPEVFLLLASSENCKVQAIRHKNKPIYGLQFHPEVEQTEYGQKIFENFIQICEKYKSLK